MMFDSNIFNRFHYFIIKLDARVARIAQIEFKLATFVEEIRPVLQNIFQFYLTDFHQRFNADAFLVVPVYRIVKYLCPFGICFGGFATAAFVFRLAIFVDLFLTCPPKFVFVFVGDCTAYQS